MPICSISGQAFEVSESEKALRAKLNAPEPDMLPKYRFQHLGAFWKHFALYERKCDATGQDVISPFRSDCPYPVWHKDQWVANANPPCTEIDFSKPFFDQLWDLFQQCPIPHDVGVGNENCEYTDDWFYSKNCYLCYSGVKNEGLSYCYRVLNLRDCMFCVFSFDSELCTDLVYGYNCYNVNYALYSRNCRDSNFLFDCVDCTDCLFCWNLRSKRYCIANRQYSKEEYERERAKVNLASQKQYARARVRFHIMIKTQAWWRSDRLEQCENSTGDYLEEAKNSENCFLIQKIEDCANCWRGYGVRDSVDCISSFSSELIFNSCLVQDQAYTVSTSYELMRCRFMEYCGFCLNCESCFGCCGLVGKKYHVFNKEYSKEEYEVLTAKIRKKICAEGIEGKFFPGHFAATPYEDSLSGFCWPINLEQQSSRGFRTSTVVERKNDHYSSAGEIPDLPTDAGEAVTTKIFWDEASQRPFQITKHDLKFCQTQNIPLPHCHYLKRMKENFSWIFFTGEQRETICAKTGRKVTTSLPMSLDGRILSREAYLKEVY